MSPDFAWQSMGFEGAMPPPADNALATTDCQGNQHSTSQQHRGWRSVVGGLVITFQLRRTLVNHVPVADRQLARHTTFRTRGGSDDRFSATARATSDYGVGRYCGNGDRLDASGLGRDPSEPRW